MAEKAETARRKRRVTLVLSSILAVVLLAGLGWFLVSTVSFGGGDDTAAKKENRIKDGDGHPKDKVIVNALSLSKPADAAKGSDKCTYNEVETPEGQPENPDITDVGTPGNGKKPSTGKQEFNLDLKQGSVTAELDNAKAPCTAASYTYLAGEDFFADSECHRLTTKDLYVLQCGDPSGTGRGGPSYQFDTEYTPKDTAKDMSEKDQKAGEKPKPNYPAGSLAMANSGETEDGKGTNGSQFFIVYEDTYLPPNYTLMGKITAGLDVVRDIAKKGAWITKKEQEERQQQQMGGMG